MNLMIAHLPPLRSAKPAIMTRFFNSCQILGFSLLSSSFFETRFKS